MTNTFKQAAEHIVALYEWLGECPFTTDGVYDCAFSEITSAEHQAVILAETTAGLDEALLESVQTAVYHGEYGTGPDGSDYDAKDFWKHVKAMCE